MIEFEETAMPADLLIKLQEWTNRIPLIILGSGASVPFNLPSMWTLGDHIKNKVVVTDGDDQMQFERFKTIFDEKGDLESALSELQLRPALLTEIVARTWDLINKADLDAYENFIESKCDFPLSRLIQYLLNTSTKRLSIITTNYDRIAEYAASIADSVIVTGYANSYIGHFSRTIYSKVSIPAGYRGQVNIWKVHGSLDWFKTKEEKNVMLPLRHSLPTGLVPSIVTPGLSKYSETHNEPYRTIFAEADKEIESANAFLCIGYGFNDSHVQPKLLAQIRNNKPIIVLAKKLTAKTVQSIIDAKCKNYILLEDGDNGITNIYSSQKENMSLNNSKYWMLGEYLALIS